MSAFYSPTAAGIHTTPSGSVARFFLTAVVVALASSVTCDSSAAQDLTLLGGQLSSDLADQNAIQAPAPSIGSAERRILQSEGFALFHRITTADEGLGPRYINRSCAGCHIDNGKGPPSFSQSNNPGSRAVVKTKAAGLQSNGSAPEVNGLGQQILDHDLFNDRELRTSLSWIETTGRYNDGSLYRLRRPNLTFSRAVQKFSPFSFSFRIAPAIIGPGLLEAVPASAIVRLSDPNDSDRDGISGRVNFVADHEKGGYSVGRFGHKATLASVKQQSASALYHDMQITNPLFNDSPDAQELADEQLQLLTLYQRLAGVPKARNQSDQQVITGKQLFKTLECNSCHRMTLVTGNSHEDPELRNQTIHPFTDLLLHDMGPGLADSWQEFSARGSEWRTAPLWGIGFVERLSKRIFYLHDGRARSIEEAILWHGGEARRSTNHFKRLSKRERDALVAFLRSL